MAGWLAGKPEKRAAQVSNRGIDLIEALVGCSLDKTRMLYVILSQLFRLLWASFFFFFGAEFGFLCFR